MASDQQQMTETRVSLGCVAHTHFNIHHANVLQTARHSAALSMMNRWIPLCVEHLTPPSRPKRLLGYTQQPPTKFQPRHTPTSRTIHQTHFARVTLVSVCSPPRPQLLHHIHTPNRSEMIGQREDLSNTQTGSEMISQRVTCRHTQIGFCTPFGAFTDTPITSIDSHALPRDSTAPSPRAATLRTARANRPPPPQPPVLTTMARPQEMMSLAHETIVLFLLLAIPASVANALVFIKDSTHGREVNRITGNFSKHDKVSQPYTQWGPLLYAGVNKPVWDALLITVYTTHNTSYLQRTFIGQRRPLPCYEPPSRRPRPPRVSA